MDIYQENGYDNRRHYIKSQAENYGVDYEEAFILADILGSNEDFDGFVTALEDHAAGFGFF